jgi:hypothetical protein
MQKVCAATLYARGSVLTIRSKIVAYRWLRVWIEAPAVSAIACSMLCLDFRSQKCLNWSSTHRNLISMSVQDIPRLDMQRKLAYIPLARPRKYDSSSDRRAESTIPSRRCLFSIADETQCPMKCFMSVWVSDSCMRSSVAPSSYWERLVSSLLESNILRTQAESSRSDISSLSKRCLSATSTSSMASIMMIAVSFWRSSAIQCVHSWGSNASTFPMLTFPLASLRLNSR